MLIDVLHQEGIQVVCAEADIVLDGLYLANRRVHVQALMQLHLHARHTEFHGTPRGRHHLGGLIVEIFQFLPFPRIIVENCTFESLQFETILSEVSSIVSFTAATLVVQMLPKDITKNAENDLKDMIQSKGFNLDGYTDFTNFLNASSTLDRKKVFRQLEIDYGYSYLLNITNSSFKNNNKALSIAFDVRHLMITAGIFHTAFIGNQFVMEGGALSTKGVSYMNIKDCNFTNNTAGWNTPIDIEPFRQAMLVSKGQKIYVSKYSVPGDRLNIWIQTYGDDVMYSVELVGEGGAIFSNESYCEIYNTVFYGNRAYRYGGSLFVKDTSHISIFDSYLETSEQPYDVVDGHLLYSNGQLTLTNVTFKALRAVSHGSFAGTVTHLPMQSSITSWVSNFSVECPYNSRLDMFNSTGLLAGGGKRSITYKEFNSLKYTCIQCVYGNYTLLHGYYSLANISAMDRDRGLSMTNYTDVACNDCAYGGVCQGGIVAKANYWGVRQ